VQAARRQITWIALFSHSAAATLWSFVIAVVAAMLPGGGAAADHHHLVAGDPAGHERGDAVARRHMHFLALGERGFVPERAGGTTEGSAQKAAADGFVRNAENQGEHGGA
jgi:hypothetical protein